MAGSTKRNLFTAAALFCLGVGLFAAFGEISVRIVSRFSPTIRYLATAGAVEHPLAPETLEEYLRSRAPHIEPGRIWLRHRANSQGFYDTEFSQTGRQILALGDSFLYGLVDLDLNVMTQLQSRLQTACGAPGLDILNTGNPAAGVWDYLTMYKLIASRINADTVLIHFYMGNDGPNLLRAKEPISILKRLRLKSYLYLFVKNATHLLKVSRHDPLTTGFSADPASNPLQAPSNRPKEVFRHELTEEIGRFYEDPDENRRAEAWKETIGDLSALVDAIRADGRKPIIIKFPSQLQIVPALFAAARERGIAEYSGNAANFDPLYPNRVLSEFCDKERVECIDITEALQKVASGTKQLLYVHGDTHWNILGNQEAAKAEAELIAPALCSTTSAVH